MTNERAIYMAQRVRKIRPYLSEDIVHDVLVALIERDARAQAEVRYTRQMLLRLVIDVLRVKGDTKRPSEGGRRKDENRAGYEDFDDHNLTHSDTPEAIIAAYAAVDELTSVLEGSGAIVEPLPVPKGWSSPHAIAQVLGGVCNSHATFFVRFG